MKTLRDLWIKILKIRTICLLKNSLPKRFEKTEEPENFVFVIIHFLGKKKKN